MNWKNYKKEARDTKEAKGQRRSKDGQYDVKATRRDVMCLSVTHKLEAHNSIFTMLALTYRDTLNH